MKLNKVTITGADDGTTIKDLVSLSKEFPFVEWGILVSKKQEGSIRFPSRNWINEFSRNAKNNNINVSTHLCGQWVRELLIGTLHWQDIPSCINVSQRVQINTHAEIHESTVDFFSLLDINKQFIFQLDNVNNHLPYASASYGLNIAALFDTSGGAGMLPYEWKTPIKNFPCGFAGGLGPNNVITQCEKINKICPENYQTWIDMEGQVRSNDKITLDLIKVKNVLTQIKNSKFIY